MKKLSEMNAREMSVCICKLAENAEKLFNDGAVVEALDALRESFPEETNVPTAFSLFTSILVPKLLSDEHTKETYAILAAIDGVTVEEIEKRNGLEIIRDLFIVFVTERDVETIFRPGCEVRRK